MSKPALYVYDDARARTWEPFALTRPVSALNAGTGPIWARWLVALQHMDVNLIGAPHLASFDDGYWPGIGTAPRVAEGAIPAGSIIANARFAPILQILDFRHADPRTPGWKAPPEAGIWLAGDRVAAVRTARAVSAGEFADGALLLDELRAPDGREDQVDGWWLEGPWDLVRLLPEMVADDISRSLRGPTGKRERPTDLGPPTHSSVLGEHPVYALTSTGKDGLRHGPKIEPHVIFDATAGPILIDHGVHVHAFTRITGPCHIGHGSTILGGDISVCSIGPVCKVRGELANTIMLGWGNKGHEGFVGHSILGRWTNLGAGTTTSNLKNTYGPVSLWTPAGIVDTGMQFLGTLFGDHAKTGIGVRLTTGTTLGAGANVYGSEMPPKAVPPFAWGERAPYGEYRLDKFLQVAERVMARRKMTLSEDARRQITNAYERRWSVEGEA